MRPLPFAAALVALSLPALAQNTIVSHGISPFGDLKYPAGFEHFDYVNPDAPKGGTLSFRGTGASTTFDSLNDFILAGEPAQGLGRIYDSLLVRSADEPGASYGLLAESIEYPEDRSWAIFTLQSGARFSDREPVTADDVVFTIETLKAEGAPVWQITLRDVASVEALDARRVKVTFAEGVPTRDLPQEVGDVPILPRHYYETHDFTKSTMEPPIGSGPFVIAGATPGRTIRYCRDPDYWAKDLNVNVGTNNFDCVVYEYFADTTAAFEALKSGTYNFHEEYFSAIWATGYDFPALSKGWVKREDLPDGRPSGTQGFWINLRREKFSDPRVREALGLMFNFEWSNKTLFYGLYSRTDSFWENSPMQAEGLPEGEELAVLEEFRDRLPPEIFTEPAYVPAVNSADAQVDRRALREASQLLDEAGWTVGADGMRRNASGEVLSVEFVDDNPSFERIILPYVENLKRLGVDARLDLVDAAQMQERQENFDYDVTAGRLVMSLTPSIELRTLFGTEGASAKGSLNLSGVADPVVDALIEKVIQSQSREELDARVKALDRVLRSMHIWVPNWYKGSFWLAYWDVFGRPEVKPPYARGDDYWWWDEDKAAALRAQGAQFQ